MKVMLKMGFGATWRQWIWWCISTAKFYVLINCVSAGFFPNSRGLRQDLLYPYLFIIGNEELSILLRRVMAGGYVLGCRFKGRDRGGLNISHLFANDAVVFYEAIKNQLIHLSWILL